MQHIFIKTSGNPKDKSCPKVVHPEMTRPRNPLKSAASGDGSMLCNHSHSMVDGGLEVISYTMRLMPLTSLTMRTEMASSTS